jgi:molybdate transport system substrate-binding protein
MTMSQTIRVLSAGAVKTGIRAAAQALEARDECSFDLRFATAPTIRGELGGGALAADVLVAPPGVIEEAVRRGQVDAASRAMLGRVGAGIAVRAGGRVPDISSVESIRQALLAADSIAFNKASTGTYIEALFERLGIAGSLTDRIRRQDNGAGVMNHLLRGGGYDIGFGAITEILVFADRGVQLVGALPDDIQNYTRYEAAVVTEASNAAGARAYVDFLRGEQGARLLADCGIEPA